MRKVKIKNLVIFLLCFVLLALFEPFGDASAYAAINRSISSESDKVARIEVCSYSTSSIKWNPVEDSGIVCHQ